MARTTRVSNSLSYPGFSAIKVSLEGAIKPNQKAKRGVLSFFDIPIFFKAFYRSRNHSTLQKKTRLRKLNKKPKDLHLKIIISTTQIFMRDLHQVILRNVRPPCVTETSGT